MARKHEAEQHLKSGLGPVEIAEAMKVSVNTVIPYLLIRVGEGAITLADIYFRISGERRDVYEEVLETCRGRSDFSLTQSCRARGLESSEIHLYRMCRDSTDACMYVHLRQLEMTVHRLVRRALESEFVGHDDAWWKEGVPLTIRQRCAQVKEADPHSLDPYQFTSFIDLKEIVDKNWRLFKDVLPAEAARDKRELCRTLDRLNQIRNAVMHPIKQVHPSEDDFNFVRQQIEVMDDARWRLRAP